MGERIARGTGRPAYNERLDTDTVTYGWDPPFQPWEADSTGMVHVLWSAKHRGLTLEKDSDEIASMIMRSRWLTAVRAMAVDAATPPEPSPTAGDVGGEGGVQS